MEILTPKNYSCAKIYKMNKTEIEKIDFSLCKEPRETLEEFYDRQEKKPDLLCNGGFYSLSDGSTVFTFVDEGKEINIDRNYLKGIGTKNGELVIGTYDKTFSDFVSGYPVLLIDGHAVDADIGSEINYNARRTILGYDNNYIYLIVVESPGYNFSKLRGMLVDLNIPNAVNLDGGGSTRVLKDGKRDTNVVYSRPVDNVISFFLKKEQPATIYRVQTGAFSIKKNAENYLATIRALDDSINAGYKNAYIRIINNLYKVQVGAFSVKANAERVVADLKRQGINSFITTM
jgi:hypothetical protein